MRSVIFALCALLVCGVASAQTSAADTDAAAPATQAGPQGASSAAQPSSPTTTSGLPQREAPARTMRAYWHVFIAFAVVWLLLFGYAVTVGRRFGKLEEEVRRMRETT